MTARSFEDVFGFAPEVTASAPGRVNLLGEHTDYNEGFVLPIAIPQQTRVKLARSRDESNHFYSVEMNKLVSCTMDAATPGGFARYLFGCMKLLHEERFAVTPVCIHVQSQIPIGMGLSSSSALEVAVLRGLRELFGLALDDVRTAIIAQQAEIGYARVNCGIMDQMAASLADTGTMLFLDARNLQHRLLPLPPGSELLVIDSGVPRSLAGRVYSIRREECEEAARLLGVRALRDVTDPAAAESLPSPMNRRARHVISENNRVIEAAGGVDGRRFGELMNASHASLRDDFEVSIPPLDVLAAFLQKAPGILGARLTGTGFGGACVALAQQGTGHAAVVELLPSYRDAGYLGKLLVG